MQFLSGLLVILLDQLTKHRLGSEAPQNTGVAFGVLDGHPELVVVLLLASAGGLAWYGATRYVRLSWLGRLAFALVVSGAVSNGIDRVFVGAVRDPFAVGPWFPNFNLADCAIVGGLLVLLAARPGAASQPA